MIKFFQILLIIGILTGCTQVFGQSSISEITAISTLSKKEYLSESWTTMNGLPVNHINQVHQTPDGYIWLATFTGLIRFDGVNFIEFNSGNSINLLSNRILHIQEGFGNEFWVTTEQYDLIHSNNGEFTWFEDLKAGNDYKVFLDDNTNITWIGGKNGLFKYEKDKLEPARTDLFEGSHVSNIYQSLNGNLWIFTAAGQAFKFYDSNVDSTPIVIEIIDGVRMAAEDKDGKLWVGRNEIGYIQNDQFFIRNIDPDFLHQWDLNHPFIFSLQVAPDSSILASTVLGLMKIENDRLQFINQSTNQQYKPLAVLSGSTFSECPDGSLWSIVDNRVYKNGLLEFEANENSETIYCDREHNLWITTFRNGLYRYRSSLFENITFSNSNNNFYGVFTDSYDGIWIGKMFGELNRIDRNGLIESYETPPGWSVTSAFAELSDGSFIAGNQRCLPKHRTETGACNSFQFIDPLRNRNIRSIYEDSQHNVWIGILEGLLILNFDENGLLIEKEWIRDMTVRYMLETKDGDIWYATNGAGIVQITANQKKRYIVENGLSSNNVRALYEDEHGYIWAATEDRGLNRIDPLSGHIDVIRKSDGLYEDGLHTILKDDHDRLWFSTNQGVFWVEFSHLQEFINGERNRLFSTHYTERDGMLNREGNGGFQNSGMRTKDGRLWFATQMGILSIKPDEININQPLPDVIIEDVLVANESVLKNGKPFELTPQQRSFTVRFNCPVFMAPERVRFRYKLVGFDSDWVDAGNRREAIYTNVPAGEFTFMVSAYFDSESTTSKETSLAMTLSPRFYETAWFPVFAVTLLVMLLSGGYRIRVKNLVNREKELEGMVYERTEDLRLEKRLTDQQAEKLRFLDQEKNRFFANISHEFRTPLTLTLGPLQDLRNGTYGQLTPDALNQVNLAIRNSRRLLRLVGQLMDLTRLENNKFELSMKAGNLSNYLRTLSEPFVPTAKRSGIQFIVDLPNEPVFAQFDDEHFDKIIANLLSNAFKFTPENGTVTLQLTETDGVARISIQDTGKGISEIHRQRLFERFYQVEKSEMQPGTGIGLSIAKELTLLHGGTIDVISDVGNGSTFIVMISAAPSLLNMEGQTTPAIAGLRSDIETIHEKTDQAIALQATDDSEPEHAIRKTILVVDDHADIRNYLHKHLSEFYHIIEATSGTEAIAAINKELPDLIMSDVMMPDGDGFELLKKIRTNPETNFLPVILLTARVEAEDKLSGLGIGANDYITKPFNVREILIRIENLFNYQKRLKHHLKLNPVTNGYEKIHHDKVEIKSVDETFLDSVKHQIQTHLSNEDFTVERLAEELNLSRSSLHRRLTKLTGESPSSMIRRIRIELGAQLLLQNAGTVSEVAYSSGFKSLAHFSKLFREHFHQTPTEFMNSHQT